MGSNITEFKVDEGLWCCKSTKAKCKVEKYIYNNVSCIGNAIKLNQQCHGEDGIGHCNYYPADKKRYLDPKRAYLDVCRDNRYVLNTGIT